MTPPLVTGPDTDRSIACNPSEIANVRVAPNRSISPGVCPVVKFAVFSTAVPSVAVSFTLPLRTIKPGVLADGCNVTVLLVDPVKFTPPEPTVSTPPAATVADEPVNDNLVTVAPALTVADALLNVSSPSMIRLPSS